MSLLRGLNGEPLAQVITLRGYRMTNSPFIIRSLFGVSSMHHQPAKDSAREIANGLIRQANFCASVTSFRVLPSDLCGLHFDIEKDAC